MLKLQYAYYTSRHLLYQLYWLQKCNNNKLQIPKSLADNKYFLKNPYHLVTHFKSFLKLNIVSVYILDLTVYVKIIHESVQIRTTFKHWVQNESSQNK